MIISKIHLTCIRKASERQDPRTNHDTYKLFSLHSRKLG